MATTKREVWDPELERRRCVGDSKQRGERCLNRPIPGGTVCRFHGGKAPQVVRSAKLRLAALVDPAIVNLAAVLEADPATWKLLEVGTDTRPGVWKRVGVDHADKIRAAEAILDRTGHPRRTELDVAGARERLIERIRDRQDT